MNADRRTRLLRDLFDRAMELPPESRAAFIRAQAGGQPELVDELLDLIRRANGRSALAPPGHPSGHAPGDLFQRKPLGDGFNLFDELRKGLPRPHGDR